MCTLVFCNPSILQTQGKASPQHFRPPKPEDVATICYTSGTTGTPKVNHASFDCSLLHQQSSVTCRVVYFRSLMLDIIFSQGVVLSHENLIANVAGSSLNIRFYPSDVLVFCIYTQINCLCLINLSNSHQLLTFVTITLWITLLRYISYLPLAHIYERVNQIATLHCGVAIGFYQRVCRFNFIWNGIYITT